MSHDKQFTIWAHASGPNPWKVKMIFEELGLSYEPRFADMQKGEHKSPEYLKLNPNGRLPTIIDHKNGDFVLWETGAIIEYLIAKYDKDHKISYEDEKLDFLTKQWLFFQVSGQGPYMGQAFWFKAFHPEKIPSAIERYEKETLRVLSVIDDHLKATNQKWLVGDKCTYADISFVTWFLNVDFATGKGSAWKEDYPVMSEWLDRLHARPAVKKIIDWKAEMAPKH